MLQCVFELSGRHRPSDTESIETRISGTCLPPVQMFGAKAARSISRLTYPLESCRVFLLWGIWFGVLIIVGLNYGTVRV